MTDSQDLFNKITNGVLKTLSDGLHALQKRVSALEFKQPTPVPKPICAGINLEFLNNCGLGHLIRKTDPEEVEQLKENIDRIDKQLSFQDRKLDRIDADVYDTLGKYRQRLTQAEGRIISLAISLIVTTVIALSAICLAVRS